MGLNALAGLAGIIMQYKMQQAQQKAMLEKMSQMPVLPQQNTYQIPTIQ
jgi:hypothetical protein